MSARTRSRALAPALALAMLGCGSGGGSDDGNETGFLTEATTSFTASSTSSGVESSAGSTSADSSTSADATTTDTSGTTGPAPGCTAIDFLYVIDNSTTMLPHQLALVADFPTFANTIETAVPASESYHVMVVKTDEGWGADCIEECEMLGGCMLDPTFPCDGMPSPCDAELGAGVLFPYGDQGSNLACEIVGDARYVVADEPDVIPAFTCLATLGTRTYDTPRTAAAMVTAIGADMTGPGGCNEGFLRPEALLVVTIVSDKDDDDSPGSAREWAQALLTAKGGDAEAVVMLALLDEDGTCPEDPETSDTLAAFVSMFPHSAVASICTDDYAAFLQSAVELIGSACDAWVPPA